MSTRQIFGLLIVLGIVASVSLGDDIVTDNGVTYSNIRVTGGDVSGVKIVHKTGVAYVPYAEMTKTDQHKYGYDPKKEEELLAEKIRKRKAAEQAVKYAVKAEEEKKQQEIDKAKKAEEEKKFADAMAKQEEIAKKEKEKREHFKPSGISVAAFHALKSTEVTVFVANARLDDYFNYEFSEAEHKFLSVRLETPEAEDIGHGYKRLFGKVGGPIDDYDQPNERGNFLFKLLFDGKWHPLIVRVKYTSSAKSSGCFFLEDYQETTGK